MHNGFQEAKRQEGEEAASAGGDVKAEALAERRETFSERWAKAVAEAHPSAAAHQWLPPAATGGLPLERREHDAAASLSTAEEAQPLKPQTQPQPQT